MELQVNQEQKTPQSKSRGVRAAHWQLQTANRHRPLAFDWWCRCVSEQCFDYCNVYSLIILNGSRGVVFLICGWLCPQVSVLTTKLREMRQYWIELPLALCDKLAEGASPDKCWNGISKGRWGVLVAFRRNLRSSWKVLKSVDHLSSGFNDTV